MIFTEDRHLEGLLLQSHSCQGHSSHSNAKYQLQNSFSIIPKAKTDFVEDLGSYILWAYLYILPTSMLHLKTKQHYINTTLIANLAKNLWSFHNINLSSLVFCVRMFYLPILIEFRLACLKTEGWKNCASKKWYFFRWNIEKIILKLNYTYHFA